MINAYMKQVENFSLIQPAVSLEIGALDGAYSVYMQDRFDLLQRDIYLVEPNPEMHAELECRLPKANLLQFAISGRPGISVLNRVKSTQRSKLGCSSLANRVDDWSRSLDYSRLEVEAITGAMLLEKINKPVDLCIIDVEGLAYEVLSSFGPGIRGIKSLMIECEHRSIFEGQRLFDDVARLLDSQDFQMMAFQFSYANQSDSVWVRKDCIA